MNSFLKLQQYAILQYFRDKEAMFWTLMFPIIFLVVFKLFGGGGGININTIVIDQSKDLVSTNIVSTLTQIEGIKLNQDTYTIEEARSVMSESQKIEFDDKINNKIEKETTDVIILIPADFATNPNSPIQIFYNQATEGQGGDSLIIESIIGNIRNSINLAQVEGKNTFEVKREGISVKEINYYDFFVPGIIGLGIMQSGIIGMASVIATYKDKGVMKRLSATPLKRWWFILAEVNTFLMISFIQITFMLLLAKFVLGAHMYGSIPLFYLLGILSSFVFLNIGFIAAAYSKNANSAASISNIFIMPMMFMSGVFFPRDGLPPTLKLFADNLPLSPLLDAFRAVILESKGLGDVKVELLKILIWTIITFVIASRVFKFKQE